MLKGILLGFSLVAQFARRVEAFDPDITLDPRLELGSPRGHIFKSNASSLIERRQTRTCVTPGWLPCSNANFCCLPGEICQPNNPRGGGMGWCCPSYGLQCSGRACCNPATAFCCGSTCCTQGSKCSNGKCVAPPATTKLTTTSRATSTTTSKTTSTSSSPLFCTLGARDLYGRQVEDCPGQPTSSSAPTPTETRLPKATMTFDYQRLRAGKKKMSVAKQQQREKAVDQLFESMCKGLKARGQTSDAIFTFTDDEKLKALNRAKAGCTGSPCSTGTSGNSCDEFPFASTTDGGVGAVFSCILVMAQNIQGGVISSFKQRNKISAGDHYKFQISGYDCKTNSPTILLADNDKDVLEPFGSPGEALLSVTKRDLLPGGLADDELESYPPFTAEDVNNTVIHSIGDLQSGTYTINAQVNQGTVSDLRVINYLGDEYARANVVLGADGRQTLTFTLEADGVGMGFFMDTQLDTVNVSSTMQVGPPNAGLRTSSTPRIAWAMGVVTSVAILISFL